MVPVLAALFRFPTAEAQDVQLSIDDQRLVLRWKTKDLCGSSKAAKGLGQ